jgi:hypothetical protein
MHLLPQTIDNTYRGRKLGLWLFVLLVALRTLQSVFIIFNGYSTVTKADGVPLATYPPAAAQTIVAMFALSSLSRLIICLICLIVVVKYRRAVPFMFVILAMTYLGGLLMQKFIPIVRVGSPPGVFVNLISFGLVLVGLALSLWKRPGPSTS